MTVNTYGALFEGATITPEIRSAAQKARSYAELRVKARSRVRSGEMRRGWTVNLEGYGIRIKNEVPYTIYNEMGTRYMSASPMAAPTIPEAQEVFRSELVKAVGRKLGARIIGDLGDRPSTFESLTQGKSNNLSGLGFRSNGSNPATLSTSRTRDFNRQFGRAKPVPSRSGEARARAQFNASNLGRSLNR